jgi:hypothetical protein
VPKKSDKAVARVRKAVEELEASVVELIDHIEVLPTFSKGSWNSPSDTLFTQNENWKKNPIHCAYCRVLFSAIKWEETEVFEPSPATHGKKVVHISENLGVRRWANWHPTRASWGECVFYFCSEDCADKNVPIMEAFKERNLQEWRELQKAKKLLGQAKALVKERLHPLK